MSAFIDKYLIKFDTGASWYIQLIKLCVGFAGVLIIKAVLKEPLIALIGNEYIARAVRYFILVIFAGVVWPLAFRPLTKIRISALDKLGSKVSSILRKRDTGIG